MGSNPQLSLGGEVSRIGCCSNSFLACRVVYDRALQPRSRSPLRDMPFLQWQQRRGRATDHTLSRSKEAPRLITVETLSWSSGWLLVFVVFYDIQSFFSRHTNTRLNKHTRSSSTIPGSFPWSAEIPRWRLHPRGPEALPVDRAYGHQQLEEELDQA